MTPPEQAKTTTFSQQPSESVLPSGIHELELFDLIEAVHLVLLVDRSELRLSDEVGVVMEVDHELERRPQRITKALTCTTQPNTLRATDPSSLSWMRRTSLIPDRPRTSVLDGLIQAGQGARLTLVRDLAKVSVAKRNAQHAGAKRSMPVKFVVEIRIRTITTAVWLDGVCH